MDKRKKMMMACIGLGIPIWIALKMKNRSDYQRKKETKEPKEKKEENEIEKILASGFFYDF